MTKSRLTATSPQDRWAAIYPPPAFLTAIIVHFMLAASLYTASCVTTSLTTSSSNLDAACIVLTARFTIKRCWKTRWIELKQCSTGLLNSGEWAGISTTSNPSSLPTLKCHLALSQDTRSTVLESPHLRLKARTSGSLNRLDTSPITSLISAWVIPLALLPLFVCEEDQRKDLIISSANKFCEFGKEMVLQSGLDAGVKIEY